MSDPAAAGVEWVVEAYGCAPAALRDPGRLQALFARLERDLALRPAAPPAVHRFPDPGGVTLLVLLQESHLAVHTFPEHGALCLNLFCCRPRPEWDFAACLEADFGARSVSVRRIDRPYRLP
jgi:S-adenosylmethionine decarboxylase